MSDRTDLTRPTPQSQVAPESSTAPPPSPVDLLDDLSSSELRKELRRRKRAELAQRREQRRQDPLTVDPTERDPYVTDCPSWCTDPHLPEVKPKLGQMHRGDRQKVALHMHTPWLQWSPADDRHIMYLAHVSGRLARFAGGGTPHIMLGLFQRDPATDVGAFEPGSRYSLEPAEALELAALLVRLVDDAAAAGGAE